MAAQESIGIKNIFDENENFAYYLKHDLPLMNSSENKMIIPVFNFVVGSYMGKMDIDRPDDSYYRNHEYPKFCRTMFEDPLSQCSPKMLDFLSKIEILEIRQYLILIDPYYKTDLELHGLKKYFPKLSFSVENNIMFNHNDINVTVVTSYLDVIVIRNSILHTDIMEYLSIIENMNDTKYVDYLVNILDCTSYTLRNFWMSNTSNKIWLSTPECLLIDSELKYNPLFTIEQKRDKYELQWVSYETSDKRELSNLVEIIDFADKLNSNIVNMYNFLLDDMKTKLLEINIISLVKLMSLNTYTLKFILSDNTEFYLNNITYQRFSELWYSNKLFSNRIISLLDPYYSQNIIKFMDNFLEILRTKSLNTTVTMMELYQEEINNIFIKLEKYLPNDFKDTKVEYPVARTFIYDYLRKHNIIV